MATWRTYWIRQQCSHRPLPEAGRRTLAVLNITNPSREWSAQQMVAAPYYFFTDSLDDLFAARFFA